MAITSTRYTYWHRHPRKFANECDPVRCTADQAKEAEAAGYERLTRAKMQRHIRWVNAENDAWGSGRAIGDYVIADWEGSGCT